MKFDLKRDLNIPQNLEDDSLDIQKLWRLHTAKKLLRNYVNIVGGTDKIDLQFAKKDSPSYTDGKTVVIGSDIGNQGAWEPSAYLAIHEASHIKHTDFEVLKLPLERATIQILDEFFPDRGSAHDSWDLQENTRLGIKTLLNLLEDERIDKMVLTGAPGYKKYYDAFDKKYVHNKKISLDALIQETGTHPLGIIRLLISSKNKFLDFSSFPGMPELISKINEVHNCTDTLEVLQMTKEMYRDILQISETLREQKQEQSSDGSENSNEGEDAGNDEDTKTESEGDNGDGESEPEKNDEPEGDNGDGEDTKPEPEGDNGDGEDTKPEPEGDNEDNPSGSDGLNNNSIGDEPTDKELKDAKKYIESLEELIRGETKKKTVSQKDMGILDAIGKSEFEIHSVAGTDGLPPMKNYIIRSPSIDLLKSPLLNFMLDTRHAWPEESPYIAKTDKALNEGIQLGKVLAKRLTITTEEKMTQYPRQKSGKLDKRRIWAGGMGEETLFQRSATDRYKPTHIHISIDASASMYSSYRTQISPFRESLKFAAAIAMASSILPNFDCEISLRYSSDKMSERTVYTPIVYDSRRDKIKDFLSRARLFTPTQLTPEGLSYEGLLPSLIGAKTSSNRTFLINFSDGQPFIKLTRLTSEEAAIAKLNNLNAYNNSVEWGGHTGIKYTKKIVDKIKNSDIGVLSYFISDSTNPYEMDGFVKMYGESSEAIKPGELSTLVRTVSKMLLKK